MVRVTKLFKNNNKPYRLLAAEDNGDVIWAITRDDNAFEAGNRVSNQEFIDMLQKEGWEADRNTAFTFVNGEFRRIEYNDHKL